jgi:hypothetical protein
METVGHLTKKMLERYAHPSSARKLAALDTFDQVRVVHAAATSEQKKDDTPTSRVLQLLSISRLLVDGRRLELPTSALRTRPDASGKQLTRNAFQFAEHRSRAHQ